MGLPAHRRSVPSLIIKDPIRRSPDSHDDGTAPYPNPGSQLHLTIHTNPEGLQSGVPGWPDSSRLGAS